MENYGGGVGCIYETELFLTHFMKTVKNKGSKREFLGTLPEEPFFLTMNNLNNLFHYKESLCNREFYGC